MTRRKAADDSPMRQAKLALLIGWSELPGGTCRGLTAAKAVDLVEKEPERYATLHHALMYFGRDGKLAKGNRVGYQLRGMKGSLMGGMKFVEAGEEHKTTLWRVGGVNPDGEPTQGQRGRWGDGGDQATHPTHGSDSHANVIAYTDDMKTRSGGEETSPPSPSSPPSTPDDREVFEL